MPIADSTSPERAAMRSRNALKIGLFGANCSSGRAVTMVPERWSGNWADCLRLAQTAEASAGDAGREDGRPGDDGKQR